MKISMINGKYNFEKKSTVYTDKILRAKIDEARKRNIIFALTRNRIVPYYFQVGKIYLDSLLSNKMVDYQAELAKTFRNNNMARIAIDNPRQLQSTSHMLFLFEPNQLTFKRNSHYFLTQTLFDSGLANFRYNTGIATRFFHHRISRDKIRYIRSFLLPQDKGLNWDSLWWFEIGGADKGIYLQKNFFWLPDVNFNVKVNSTTSSLNKKNI